MILYEFLYCDCIYESGYVTISLHQSKAGAYKAMREYITKKAIDERDNHLLFGGRRWSIGNPFTMERWKVKPINVLP